MLNFNISACKKACSERNFKTGNEWLWTWSIRIFSLLEECLKGGRLSTQGRRGNIGVKLLKTICTKWVSWFSPSLYQGKKKTEKVFLATPASGKVFSTFCPLWQNNWYSIVCTDVPHLVCPIFLTYCKASPPVGYCEWCWRGHRWTCVCSSPCFQLFWTPQEWNGRVCGGLVWPFEELQTVFHCSCTKLQSQQHCARALTSHPGQHVLFSVS